MFTWIRMYSSPWSRNVLKYGFQYYRIRCCFIVLFFFPGKTSTKFVGHQLCAKQFAWCFEMKRRLLVICGCFWRLCSFLSHCPVCCCQFISLTQLCYSFVEKNYRVPHYVNTRPNMCLSHTGIQSPHDSLSLRPACWPWHTFWGFPAPGFRLSCFLHLPDEVCLPLKVRYRFSYFQKTFLTPFYLELVFSYHLTAFLNWLESFFHRMVITFGRRHLYFLMKNFKFKLPGDLF